jgi:ribosomal protein S18 acetylase RimI-like enzyme
MRSGQIRIVEARVGDLERVEPLWRSMVEFHRDLSGAEWPVRSAQDAWELRSAQYREWLGGEECWLLLAVDPEAGEEACGYAVLRLVEPGPTWELGERIGEIESLAVAEDARGGGAGTALIEAARERLIERGIRFWTVDVVEMNAGATRLYRRHGFRNYYRQLLGDIEAEEG